MMQLLIFHIFQNCLIFIFSCIYTLKGSWPLDFESVIVFFKALLPVWVSDKERCAELKKALCTAHEKFCFWPDSPSPGTYSQHFPIIISLVIAFLVLSISL